MRKNIWTLLTGSVILLCNHSLQACDYYVWIGSSSHQNYFGSDTICINEGESVPLYALHTYNFTTFFQDPIRSLIWTRDGIPFDTTNHTHSIYDGNLYYVTTMMVSQPGVYKVKYITPHNQVMEVSQVTILFCGSSSTSFSALPAAGTPPESAEESVTVYPNPSYNGYVYVEPGTNMDVYTLEVFDLNGKKVFSTLPNSNESITINTFDYQDGIYFISIHSTAGTFRKKIIVTH